MKYKTEIGSFADASELLFQKGGQLYSSDSKEGPFVVVRGGLTTTFWPSDSYKRGQLKELCEVLGLDYEQYTGGRLARFFLKNIIELNTKGTYFHKRWRDLARDGWHWHYSHVVPGCHGWSVEFDIKSAYFSTLFRQNSFFVDGDGKEHYDGGALDNLKQINPVLPKWFRLQLLGVIASHERKYFIAEADSSGYRLLPKAQSSISYGAAFNAVHYAILRTYKVLQEIHRIAGPYLLRAHTDSFTLSVDIPSDQEDRIWSLLAERNYEISIKGCGRATFLNTNQGALGKKIIGEKRDTLEQFREEGLKHQTDETPGDELKRFKRFIPLIEQYIEKRKTETIPVQLILDGLR